VLPARLVTAGDASSPPANPPAAPGPVGKYLAERHAELLRRTAAGESL